MPPFVGRKRSSPSPPATRRPPAKKARLGDALDHTPKSALAKARTFSVGSDSDSSLSEIDSDDFEDVAVAGPSNAKKGKVSDDDEDDDVEWEDANAQEGDGDTQPEREYKDIKITLSKDDPTDFEAAARAANGKKGPSKREKHARIMTHKMHVQLLMWHNAVRNSWIGDKQVQETLVSHLPSQIVKEVEKWRRASGLLPPDPKELARTKDKKGKRKKRSANDRDQRDWGRPSQHLDAGKPDMSRGDPIIYLLRVLAAYWKKKFAITAPGLRKRGYSTKLTLRQEIESFRKEKHNPAKHGEFIKDIKAFRKIAEKCEGSRDVGAQLFTALLRGLGIEARLVASLQPSGYGWTKAEQMVPRKVAPALDTTPGESDDSGNELKPTKVKQTPKKKAKAKAQPMSKARNQSSRGMKAEPIDLDTDNEEDESILSDNTDDSVLDVTPIMPKARRPKYDLDLAFPIYWTEAISPITSKVVPVCPLVLENASTLR